jgi:hypothetical protein
LVFNPFNALAGEKEGKKQLTFCFRRRRRRRQQQKSSFGL